MIGIEGSSISKFIFFLLCSSYCNQVIKLYIMKKLCYFVYYLKDGERKLGVFIEVFENQDMGDKIEYG